VSEFEAAPGAFGCDVKANQCAEAHAVRVLQVRKIEDDALVVRDEGPNAGEKNVRDPGNQLAVTMHDGDLARTVFHIEREDGRPCGIGHAESPV
jgi:hypothetical protein